MEPTEPGQSSRHLGLDLGATNIKWAVAERYGEDWRILDRGRIETPSGGEPAAVIQRLIEIGREAIARSPGVSSVGIGVPGLYDPPSGTTRFLVNMPGGWAGVPVAGPVGDALRLPAHLINDARAFGLAELRLGAARGASSMIGLTLGTGVGGVIAVDGRVHHGHDGTGGEIGHQTIDPDGPWCGCGNRGCLEAFARADQITTACDAPSVEQAVARARAGDQRAIDGLTQIGRYLGIGIGNMIAVISPDRVVLGGGVAAAADLLLEPIRAELRRRVHVTSLDEVEIVNAELGTWAGAMGAALHGAEITDTEVSKASAADSSLRVAAG
jgi:glucokinase